MGNSTGRIVVGVLAGMAVGALLGVLFAPDKGSETRKKISDKGEDLVDDVKEKINKLIDELNKKIDEAKSNVADATK